ncbi:MAG: M3 family oligoendopeptidase [Acidimicrobiia bacterium]
MTAIDDVVWDLEPLLEGTTTDELLDRAALIADELVLSRGLVASMDARQLAAFMHRLSDLHETLGRAGSFSSLRFAADTSNAEIAAAMQQVGERSTAITTPLVFFELEWCAVDDARAEALLADEQLAFCRHHLASMRRFTPHQLSEAEERLDSEKSISGISAWTRLFGELTAAITCIVPDPSGPDASPEGDSEGATKTVGLDQGIAMLFSPDRSVRQRSHAGVTAALDAGIKTRAYIYNTVILDRSIDDRLRRYDTWISSWNLNNQASDASVKALVHAVRTRYDIPQRWYRLKSQLLGHELTDYDRYAAVTESRDAVSWADGTAIVLDAYRAFSPELAKVVGEFIENRWIDVPPRPGKRPGAFCSYTVPSHHPYLFLNWTNRNEDVLTLAHELGHGLHGYLARPQGVFHQWTPLTVAETASVFGETLTFNRLLDQTADPSARLALLAGQVEGGIGTVFRQTAMHCFEEAVHTSRRRDGELSVERFGDLWIETQREMLGDAVTLTDGYRSWWSYIPHFINTPGYVYAYAFGQLLALSVFGRYVEVGSSFVPRYLDMLAAGGSRSPEELAAMVGCDLADPAFWDGGLAIMSSHVDAAAQAARDLGRVS